MVAIGEDGAPFGKDDEATAWLLSFINVGEQIASHNENFLLAGANCSKSHVVMKLYAKKLVSDIAYVESKRYTVAGYPVSPANVANHFISEGTNLNLNCTGYPATVYILLST